MEFKTLIALALFLASAPGSDAASACAPDCRTVASGTDVAVPWDCTAYATCLSGGGGITIPSDPLYCPPGQYFNGFECDTMTDGCDVTIMCNPCEPYWGGNGVTTPFPNNCSKFYVGLQDGVLLEVDCAANTPFYDYRTGDCQTDDTLCFDFCDECVPYCVRRGNIPDHYDCTAFYTCDPPEELHFHCPANENFDRTIGLCSTTTGCIVDCVNKAESALFVDHNPTY